MLPLYVSVSVDWDMNAVSMSVYVCESLLIGMRMLSLYVYQSLLLGIQMLSLYVCQSQLIEI